MEQAAVGIDGSTTSPSVSGTAFPKLRELARIWLLVLWGAAAQPDTLRNRIAPQQEQKS
jgi:hypothetical protein